MNNRMDSCRRVQEYENIATGVSTDREESDLAAAIEVIDLLDSDEEQESPVPPQSTAGNVEQTVKTHEPRAVKSTSKQGLRKRIEKTDTPAAAASNTGLSGTARKSTAQARLNVNEDDLQFLDNFDPDSSNRERRKLDRKLYHTDKKGAAVHDENGALIQHQIDICDCLEEQCPGCWFPCPKCRSNKCGPECRQNRKFNIEYVECCLSSESTPNKYFVK